MTLSITMKRTARSAALVLAVFASFFYHPGAAHAREPVDALPTLADFSEAVQNGEPKVLRGVYIDDLFALPIVQQPSGSPAYVSSNDGEITQFGMAAQYGNIGLLAHNHLSGKLFARLTAGQQVRLVYGDGRVESFVITQVLRYQALQPNSPYSSFRNMDKTEDTANAQQMFERTYLGDRHVTFQTCIAAYGNPSWGRLFVIAVPRSDDMSINHPGTDKNQ